MLKFNGDEETTNYSLFKVIIAPESEISTSHIIVSPLSTFNISRIVLEWKWIKFFQ